MNQLTTYESKALSLINKEEQHYVNIRVNSPQLKTLNPKELEDFCKMVFTMACIDYSSKPEVTELIIKSQAVLIVKELGNKYLSLTKAELEECFKQGIRGEFGQFFGLCPATYHKFIKGFYDKEERRFAWKNYMDKIEQESRAVKPVVITKDYLIKVANKAQEEYYKTGQMPFVGDVIYDATKVRDNLDSLVLKEDREEINIFAILDYKEKIKGNLIAKDWPMDLKVNTVYANSYKKIALTFYWDRVKK